MALTATYDGVLSRVRLAADLLGATATYAVFDKDLAGGAATFATVRGGTKVTVSAQNAALDDYEFPAGVQVTYRVRSFNASDVLQATFTVSVTQDLTAVWVKVVARPFLNRAVVVADRGPIERPARGGVFPVVGRSFPVAVSDVRGSKQYTLQVLTQTPAEQRDLDLLLASGEPIFVHVPAVNTRIPTGYFVVGDTAETPTLRLSQRRLFELPLIEIAAPGPDVIGASITWQGVLNAYTTWQDLLNAHTTWNSVLELIGSPTDVITP